MSFSPPLLVLFFSFLQTIYSDFRRQGCLKIYVFMFSPHARNFFFYLRMEELGDRPFFFQYRKWTRIRHQASGNVTSALRVGARARQRPAGAGGVSGANHSGPQALEGGCGRRLRARWHYVRGGNKQRPKLGRGRKRRFHLAGRVQQRARRRFPPTDDDRRRSSRTPESPLACSRLISNKSGRQ